VKRGKREALSMYISVDDHSRERQRERESVVMHA